MAYGTGEERIKMLPRAWSEHKCLPLSGFLGLKIYPTFGLQFAIFETLSGLFNG